MMRPRGIVRLFELDQRADPRAPIWQRGRLLWERENLFVNSGNGCLANLLAGVTAGQFVSAVGFGSGNTAPTVNDLDLAGPAKYYNAVGSHSFPAAGTVQFNYSLQTTDYAATGMTIQELGLFTNSGAVSLPAAIGTAFAAWSASTAEAVGNLIVDANGNIQRCVTAGTTGGSAPGWNTTPGGTTTDGTVVWALVAEKTAPGPMVAHVVTPAFPYSGAGNYAGQWTLTF